MTRAKASFPAYRARRMRQSEGHRRLASENQIRLDQFIMPYFLGEGTKVKEEIPSMPGQYRFSKDTILPELEGLVGLGIRAVLLFGIGERRDERASSAWALPRRLPPCCRSTTPPRPRKD